MIVYKKTKRYNQLKKFVKNKLIDIDLENHLEKISLSNKEAFEFEKLLLIKRYAKEHLSGNNFLNRIKTIYQPRNFESFLMMNHFEEKGIRWEVKNLVESIKLLEDEK